MDLVVNWNELKKFVTERNLSIQCILINNTYCLSAVDGPSEISTQIPIITPTPPGSAQEDFENNFQNNINKSIKSEVITQYEKDDKTLKLARGYGLVNANGQAVVYVKVPGKFGVGSGRYLMGGYGISADYNPDDFITCFVEDKDRNIAMMIALAMNPSATKPVSDATIQGLGILPGINKAFPNYPIIQSYTDDEQIIENQGWYFWPLATTSGQAPVGEVEVNPIGGYGHAPSGVYLKIIYNRPQGIVTGSIRLNIDWGSKDA